MNKDNALKVKMPFGKHKGNTIGNILNEDIGYLNWVINNIELRGILLSAIETLKDDIDKEYEIYCRSGIGSFFADCGYGGDLFDAMQGCIPNGY